MLRVVAVVCSYWPSRLGNVEQIVNDLQAGSVVPDRILVLNNNKDHHLKFDGAEVINSGFNSRTRGKFIVALLDVADYYLLLDDDTSVKTKTLEKFLSVAIRTSCHASHGKMLGGYANHHNAIFPHEIIEETPCDYVLGTGMFISYSCLARMVLAEDYVRRPTQWKHEGDDILIGLTNKPTIIPLQGEETFTPLSWGTEAMDWGSDGRTSGQSEYYEMRYKFMNDVVEILKEHPLPDY